MTAAQLFCKYVNLTLMLTDSFYWLGIYQIELAGLHDWSMCSLILRVVRCEVSGVYLIWISGGYWLTVVNISQHKPKPSPTYLCGRWKDGKIDLHQQTKKRIRVSHIFSKSSAYDRKWSTCSGGCWSAVDAHRDGSPSVNATGSAKQYKLFYVLDFKDYLITKK